jgi:hypothetical protein
MGRLVKEIKEYVELYIDDKTGIAWIENGSTGNTHSCHPNISVSGSVVGMKKQGYWGKDDVVVRLNGYRYNTSKYSVSDELDRIAGEYCQCEQCRVRRENNN